MKILFLTLSFSACSEGESGAGGEDKETLGSCSYQNLFSQADECRSYIGEAWDEESAADDCAGQSESSYRPEPCASDPILGTCLIGGESSERYQISFPGEDDTLCQNFSIGCEIFAGGVFSPSERCEGKTEEGPGIGTGGQIFQPPTLLCEEGDEAGCVWQAIGGCVEDGQRFAERASCDVVRSQRPYLPVEPSGFETPADDPIRSDEAYLTELEWVRAQGEACGCVCCHSAAASPEAGPAVWDTSKPGLWADDFTPRGLAMSAGWIESSSLGAYPPEENNGFDRSITIMPTTDIERMARFFEGELTRRGYTREDFADSVPVGGPLYTQRIYEPEECDAGQGVSASGELSWAGGGARYVYLLEAGSENPSTPPNLDLPEGTLWRLDVSPEDDPLRDGFAYGVVPAGATQRFPESEAAPALEAGKRYYIYVLQDMAIPITRCLFTYTPG